MNEELDIRSLSVTVGHSRGKAAEGAAQDCPRAHPPRPATGGQANRPDRLRGLAEPGSGEQVGRARPDVFIKIKTRKRRAAYPPAGLSPLAGPRN